MEFTQHMINYYRGEKLEAVLLTAFGIMLAVLVLAIWRQLDDNGLLKGLFYPLAFLAVFTTLVGGFGVYNNSQRLLNLPIQYAENPNEFVTAEHARFEAPYGVNAWWLPLKLLWAALVIAGMVMTFSARSDFYHGLAIGLIIIGAAGFVIDGFAHNRAKTYFSALSLQ